MANACFTYSEKASYAYVLCTTSSAVDAIAGTALPVFDSDHDDVVFTNNTSDDITYTAAAGTFTRKSRNLSCGFNAGDFSRNF